MKQKFSGAWKSSKQTRKQRKYRINAPLHLRTKLIASHLSDELSKKFGRRTISLRKGDTVKIMCGAHKGKESKIERTDVKKMKVYLEKLRVSKKDGSEVPVSIDPSNLMVISINSDDKLRFKKASEIKND